MSDLQTSMGGDILQMIVCLRVRDGKEAVEQLNLRAIYPEEAKNVALDIRTKLCASELALQHRASAQHQHPKLDAVRVGGSSSGPPSSGDDSQ